MHNMTILRHGIHVSFQIRRLPIEFSIKRVISNDAFLEQLLTGRVQVKRLKSRILQIKVLVSKKTKSPKQGQNKSDKI